MTKTTSIIALLTGLILTDASHTYAQSTVSPKAFINVSAGIQPASQTLDNTFAVPIYGQTATAATSQTIDGEAIFDINVGYRVWRDIAVSVGFASFSSTGTMAGSASVPSPIFFNQFKTVDIGGASAKRTDRNIYILAVWFLPVTDKIDLALSVGPSGTSVKQEVVTSMTVPAGTQTATANIESQSGTAIGVNVGLDASYFFTKRYGAGLFVRYNGGSVDLPSAPELKAGGFQTGIGVRLRF